MDREVAIGAVSLLVTGIPKDGWTEDVVDRFLTELISYRDDRCAVMACEALSRSWQWNSIPNLRDLHDAYKAEVMRRELSEQPRGELPSGDRPVEWRRGLQIAEQEYLKACEKDGRAPTPGRVPSFLARAYEKRS